MLIETLSQSFRKARAVNTTDNGFPSRVPTATQPVGTGNDVAQAVASAVFDLGGWMGGEHVGQLAQNFILLCPYAIGSDNNAFSLRVIGWRAIGESAPGTMLWIPVPLVELSCTISAAQTGVAGMTVLNTEMFADTLAVAGTTANAGTSVDVVSPANDTIAHATVDLSGFEKCEITFTTGGSATSCNALIAWL